MQTNKGSFWMTDWRSTASLRRDYRVRNHKIVQPILHGGVL